MNTLYSRRPPSVLRTAGLPAGGGNIHTNSIEVEYTRFSHVWSFINRVRVINDQPSIASILFIILKHVVFIIS